MEKDMGPVGASAAASSVRLGDVLNVLARVRHTLRDRECDLRKEADRIHILGFEESGHVRFMQAEVLAEAVEDILEIERGLLPPNDPKLRHSSQRI